MTHEKMLEIKELNLFTENTCQTSEKKKIHPEWSTSTHYTVTLLDFKDQGEEKNIPQVSKKKDEVIYKRKRTWLIEISHIFQKLSKWRCLPRISYIGAGTWHGS